MKRYFLLIVLSSSFAFWFSLPLMATNNPWTHIYYYGWYDGVWAYTSQNPLGHAFRPVFSSQCPYVPYPPNPPQHQHAGVGNTDVACVFYPDIGVYKNIDDTTASRNTIDAHKANISSAQIKNGVDPVFGTIF